MTLRYRSPIGWLELAATRKGVARCRFVSFRAKRGSPPVKNAILSRASARLGEYFKGERRRFTLPLDLQGTPFERRVWRHLGKISYGRTVSYREIARSLGRPTAFRAVGQAVSKNPAALLVPCHRVVRSDGALSGYAWGAGRKKWLIRHERLFLRRHSRSS